MLSNIQRNIIIRALEIRKNQGEEPADILDGYTNLTETEKADILAMVMPGKEQPWERY
ncbi:hypothetical protein [Enterocloster bolteae]|uniref:hypothetical protein n=1 Tax=Enterocloster bolteae TaxID=208479 RepID=UPI0029021B86|nr:hypothetical protein [Enterocloster bolteae]MDU1138246.1 hypothetical protein [Enterocloster bolteae]